jgi:hypothetical protein
MVDRAHVGHTPNMGLGMTCPVGVEHTPQHLYELELQHMSLTCLDPISASGLIFHF